MTGEATMYHCSTWLAELMDQKGACSCCNYFLLSNDTHFLYHLSHLTHPLILLLSSAKALIYCVSRHCDDEIDCEKLLRISSENSKMDFSYFPVTMVRDLLHLGLGWSFPEVNGRLPVDTCSLWIRLVEFWHLSSDSKISASLVAQRWLFRPVTECLFHSFHLLLASIQALMLLWFQWCLSALQWC